MGSIPGFPGERNGSPLQYSCLGNPMDRGAWQATVYGVTKKTEHNLTTKQQLNNKRELNLRSIVSAQLKCTLMLTTGSVLKNKSVELIHLTLTETLCLLTNKSMFPSPLSPWKPAFQYLTL